MGLSAVVIFLGIYLLDYVLLPLQPSVGPLRLLFRFDVETAQNALGNLAQVVVAVLGIVITVVSIVVQLSATRYTPRIAPLFFRDNKNLAMLGFFVVTCIMALWVSLSVSRAMLPRVAIALTLILVSLSLLLILPYFAYVFNFLDPEKIIHRIKDQTLSAAIAEAEDVRRYGTEPERQKVVIEGIEQLGDIAVNAIASRDKLIASSAIDALKDLAVSYLALKQARPPSWFVLSRALRQNPDFVALASESLNELTADKTWLEWKALRQLLTVFSVAIAELPDIGHLIAIDARYVAETAIEVNDEPALRLSIKFFNTFLRTALNHEQVRSAYNVLNQYRQIGEKLIEYDQTASLLDIAEHLRYYAHTSLALHLGFVTETIAYDMASLCEKAYERKSPAHEALLDSLLLLDHSPDSPAQEVTLRGVRKAQAKLSTIYLLHGDEAMARRIFNDLAEERTERLRSIRSELLAIHAKDFWEIVDRGTNFDYLDPKRKEQLAIFFSWFQGLDEG